MKNQLPSFDITKIECRNMLYMDMLKTYERIKKNGFCYLIIEYNISISSLPEICKHRPKEKDMDGSGYWFNPDDITGYNKRVDILKEAIRITNQ